MKKIIYLFLISLVIACSNDNEQVLNNTSSKVIVKKNSPLKTRASLDEKNLYSIQYKNIYIKDVPLNDDDVNKLQVASTLSDPIPVSVKGCSEWTVRTTGNKGGNWYKFSISSDNNIARARGIAPGVYIVRDIWLWQTYELPTPLAIVFNNNDYSGYTKMGWDPETIKTPGFKWSLSGNKVTLQTAAILIKYTLSGQETHYTYPVDSSNLEWNFYYIKIQ